jgi:RNA polymerase sigma-70 factor (ECF subfamily)
MTLGHEVQEQVYHDFYLLVYRTVFFILRDHAATEDIIQEAFLRAIAKATLLDEQEKHESWLKKLTRNVTLNHLRKLKRNRDELDEGSQYVVMEMAASVDLTEARLEKEVELKLMRDSITRYVNELIPSYRQILAMKWIYNMSYKEMADELELTEGAVRQRLYRARDAIRKRLEQEWGLILERRG